VWTGGQILSHQRCEEEGGEGGSKVSGGEARTSSYYGAGGIRVASEVWRNGQSRRLKRQVD